MADAKKKFRVTIECDYEAPKGCSIGEMTEVIEADGLTFFDDWRVVSMEWLDAESHIARSRA